MLAAIEAALGGVLTAMGALPLVLVIGTWLSPRPDPYATALFGLGALVFVPLGASLLLAGVALWSRWRHWRILQLLPLMAAAALVALT
jgi:hypothetical protein